MAEKIEVKKDELICSYSSCFSVKQQFSVGLGAPGGPPHPFRGPKGHTGVHKNSKTLFVVFILILSWVYWIAVNF